MRFAVDVAVEVEVGHNLTMKEFRMHGISSI
jgi:hypothetical protein